MRIVEKEKVEYRFTFTERELWVKKPFTPRVLPSKDPRPGSPPNDDTSCAGTTGEPPSVS